MRTWAQINAKRIKHINYGAIAMGRVLRDVRKEVYDRYLATGSAGVSRADVENEIRKGFIQIYTSAGTDFAADQISTFKSRGLDIEMKDTMFDVWRRYMERFVKESCGHKIAATTRTLFADIERITQMVVAEATEGGWGVPKIAREIRKRQGQIDAYRAMRIARTEVVGASNTGSHLGAGSLGIQTRTIWLATDSGNKREFHWDLHNTSVPYGERFSVTTDQGDTDYMLYPHDPEASAGNVIQCRCASTYEPVNSYIDQLLGG